MNSSKKITGPRKMTTNSGNFLCFLPNFPETGKNSFIYIAPTTGEWLPSKSEMNLQKPINDTEWKAVLNFAGKTLSPMNSEEIETAKAAIADRSEILKNPAKFKVTKENWLQQMKDRQKKMPAK